MGSGQLALWWPSVCAGPRRRRPPKGGHRSVWGSSGGSGQSERGGVVSCAGVGVPVIVTFVCLYSARLSSSFAAGNDSDPCPIQRCWESYHASLDSHQIRDNFDRQPSSSEHSRSAADRRRLCSIYRTFSACVNNATRDCVGDLQFHSIQRGVKRKIVQYNCTWAAAAAEKSDEAATDEGSRKLERTEEKDGDAEEEEAGDSAAEAEQTKCFYQESNVTSHRHCAMYGDPHLRTFGGEYQTCRIQGAWPLVDNDYLTVQITSAPVGVGEGTSITEVTVVIKRHDLCALDRYITYQAENGELPGTFDDGIVSFNAVEIVEYTPGLHVEIDISYKQTVVIIRLTGLAYSVSVSIPDDIYTGIIEAEPATDEGTTQLCRSGCPISERVDLNSYFGQKSSKLKRTVMMSKKEALERCRALRFKGFYFDSCVYDLMTTGDSTFTGASYASYSDLLRFVPEATFAPRNITDEKYGEQASGSHRLDYCTALLSLLFVSLHVKYHHWNL